MKLRALTLSLFTIYLAGCASTTALKPLPTESADQIAYALRHQITGNESYYYQGSAKIDVVKNKKTTKTGQASDIKTELTEYAKAKKQRQDLLHQLNQKQGLSKADQLLLNNGLLGSFGDESSKSGISQNQMNGMLANMSNFLFRYIKALRFNYSGVVDPKQGHISLTPSFVYDEPNLRYESRLPMILDFKKQRFYADLSILSSIITDPAYDGTYSYVDIGFLSKLLDIKDKKTVKTILDFWSEGYAASIYYPNTNSRSMALTESDKALNGQQRFRLTQNVVDYATASLLYSAINEKYMQKLNNKFSSEMINSIGQAAQLVMLNTMYTNLMSSIDNEPSTTGLESDADAVEAAEVEYESVEALEAVEAAAMAAEYAADETVSTEVYASSQPKSAPGRLYFYLHPEKDQHVQDQSNVDEEMLIESDYGLLSPELEAKLAQFAALNPDNTFVRAEQFGQILKDNSELYQQIVTALKFDEAFKDIQVLQDFVLDDQSRLVHYYMNASVPSKVFGNKLPIKKASIQAYANYQQYGNAHIDSKLLSQAKPFREVSNQNAMFNLGEVVDEGIKSLSADDIKTVEQINADRAMSMPDQERMLAFAKSLYAKNQNYVETFKAMYAYQYLVEEWDADSNVSANEIDRVATLYAFKYASVNNYALSAKQRAALQNYDFSGESKVEVEYLADYVDTILISAIKEVDSEKKLTQMRKNGASSQAIFAEHYLATFNKNYATNHDGTVNTALLTQVANELGRLAAMDANGELKGDHAFSKLGTELIDYVLYEQIYERVFGDK